MENTAGPTIFKSTNVEQGASQISKGAQGWVKRNMVKIGLIVLGIAVLGEIIFGAVTLFSPASSRNFNILQPQVREMRSAQLSLLPEKTAYKKNETVVFDIKLFTGGYSTDSTDVVIKYDPAFLVPLGDKFASVGQIYSEYPAVQIDQKNGLIGISGITLPGSEGFSGVGNFARLNFKALKDGQTTIALDYQPNSTADSNVVLSGSTQDILGFADSAQVEISETAVGAAPVSSGSACESFTQYCQDSTGKVGTQVCKAGTINKFAAGAVNNDSCGYDPVATVSCEVCKI